MATAFFALNPNLLYLSTTAMTEPLFLALLIWLTLLTMECVAAIRAERRVAAMAAGADWVADSGGGVYALRRLDSGRGGVVRDDVAALAEARAVADGVGRHFAIFTLLAVAGPVSWLWYNQHFIHDPLDFMRGPYSAAAIEKRTSPPGSHHYRGWHNPGGRCCSIRGRRRWMPRCGRRALR